MIVNLPNNYVFTTQNSASDNIDSDVSSLNGKSDNLTLGSNDSNLDLDAGIYLVGEIGNFVFKDIDGDGVFNGSDSALGNVTVNLYLDHEWRYSTGFRGYFN